MTSDINFNAIKEYFQDKLDQFGVSPRGVDWNSPAAQQTRFDQLLKVVDPSGEFSLLDYGSGFGSLADYMFDKGWDFRYVGFDILPGMVAKGQEHHKDYPQCTFTAQEDDLPVCDYAVASGIFNIKLDVDDETWTAYVIGILEKMNRLARRGFSFNLLTKYSDREYMKPNLYYADPCLFFDYCKRHFSRNVALLHDYELYDFTMIVRR